MHDLMNWDDDEPRDRMPTLPPIKVSATPAPTLPKIPNGNGTGIAVTFRDVIDGKWREGTIIRTIQSREHDNAYLGHLPVITLYLVAYTSETRTLDYTVISDKLIHVPPKPRV